MTSGYIDVVFGLTGKRTLQPRGPWKICKCDENNVNCCWIADVLYYVLLLFCTACVQRRSLVVGCRIQNLIILYYIIIITTWRRKGAWAE